MREQWQKEVFKTTIAAILQNPMRPRQSTWLFTRIRCIVFTYVLQASIRAYFLIITSSLSRNSTNTLTSAHSHSLSFHDWENHCDSVNAHTSIRYTALMPQNVIFMAPPYVCSSYFAWNISLKNNIDNNDRARINVNKKLFKRARSWIDSIRFDSIGFCLYFSLNKNETNSINTLLFVFGFEINLTICYHFFYSTFFQITFNMCHRWCSYTAAIVWLRS